MVSVANIAIAPFGDLGDIVGGDGAIVVFGDGDAIDIGDGGVDLFDSVAPFDNIGVAVTLPFKPVFFGN